MKDSKTNVLIEVVALLLISLSALSNQYVSKKVSARVN